MKGRYVEFSNELKYLFQNGVVVLHDETIDETMTEFLDNQYVGHKRHLDRDMDGDVVYVYFLDDGWKERY